MISRSIEVLYKQLKASLKEKHRTNKLNHEPDGKTTAAGKGNKKPGQGKKVYVEHF